MKHTPGPWGEVLAYCEGKGTASQLGKNPNEMPNIWSYRLYRNETDIEAHFNIKLMKAAPDMLKACQAALIELEDVFSLEPTGHILLAIRKIEAAISKATE